MQRTRIAAEDGHPASAAAERAMLPLTAAALFLSATLLFAVQPMFAKMALPRLGGAPGVWSVAMVFFQAVLLAGYAWAWVLVRWLSPRAGAVLHLLVLAAALAFLPPALAQGWGRPPETGQIPWLLALFAVSIGLPFFALAATAPLLQAWYARSGAPGARDPYFLYGASNLGSFAALLGYPVAIEPRLSLGAQAWTWAAGYLLLGGLVAALAIRAAALPPSAIAPPGAGRESVDRRAGWLVFAFIPSAMLVAVTAHITTDVAAAPFLWVLPLGLYLLTFVLVFRARQRPGPDWFSALLPGLVAIAVLNVLRVTPLPLPAALVLHLTTFFVAAMVAHARLYATRPAADRLTSFYLWMSLGGVLGGAFSAIAAPYLFSSVIEYPFLLVAALALLIRPRRVRRPELAFGAALLALAASAAAVGGWTGYRLSYAHLPEWRWAVTGLAMLAIVAATRRPFLAAAALALLVVAGPALEPNPRDRLLARSFFGVLRVSDLQSGDRRILYHGTTIHGAQALAGGEPRKEVPEPLTYYHRDGPMAEALRVLRDTGGWRLSPVGIVGLGAGSLACWREEGERFEFFEIDRAVVEIASDPRLFSFLSGCAPEAPIRLGDARLTLADSAGGYEALVIDAFSSDAIPVHLMTREAVALYFARMQPHGVVILHVSNRHLDLVPVVAAIAADLGLVAWEKEDVVSFEQRAEGKSSSRVVLLARRDEDLGSLPADGWEKVQRDPNVAAWTDDYSDVFGALVRKAGG